MMLRNSDKLNKNQYIPTAKFYSQVVDSLQDFSIITIDNDLFINSWSSGSITIFGYQQEEIIGKPFEIIFTDEDKLNRIPELEINTAAKEGRAVDNRWHLCKDGSKFYANGLVFPLTGEKGEQLGFVKILRDLTERKKAEDELNKYIKDLEELNAHKESILAILSHDLRSPLARIISIAEYLKNDLDQKDPAEVKQLLQFLYNASTDELKMLDYLLEWARIKYASQVFSPAKIDIEQYVTKVFEVLHLNASAKKIQLESKIGENVTAYADGKMILSAIQNIVSNAISHSHENGIITVSASRKDENIVVEITDNGPGMSEEIQKSIFMPDIERLSAARQEGKGAGIGLLLTKSFIEKNLGEIWVKSTKGKGTSFYFSLPAHKPSDNTNLENNNGFLKSV